MSVLSINKNNFREEIVNADKPVLIDFWAAWCNPCRMFSPIIDQVAEENTDKVKVVKINIDEEPELAEQFGVMSIPTLVFIKNGEIVSTSVGLKPKVAVEEMIK